MNDLEIRLKSLRVREPSPDLRGRIFGGTVEQAPVRRPRFVRRRVPLAWAAVFSVLMGCLGFLLARELERSRGTGFSSAGSTTVEIHLVERPAGRAVFDFTPTLSPLPEGPYRVDVKSRNEV